MNKPLCAVCHRPLRSEASIAAGVGPVCAGKQSKSKQRKIRFQNGGGHTYNNGATGEPLTTAQTQIGDWLKDDRPFLIIQGYNIKLVKIGQVEENDGQP